jgi:hypothetical protein
MTLYNSLEGTAMGIIERPQQERRQKAIEELRCNKVGTLLQIIEKLEGMNLTAWEIETILKTCGLNDDCATRFGAIMRIEKEKGNQSPDRPLHP